MRKLDQFSALFQSPGFLGFFVVAGLITGVFALATNIYKEPKGWKTGMMSGIAFLMGAMATVLYAQ